MSEDEFRKDDIEYERTLDERDELEREDICAMALDPSQRIYPQPVVALIESLGDEWDEVA